MNKASFIVLIFLPHRLSITVYLEISRNAALIIFRISTTLIFIMTIDENVSIICVFRAILYISM